MITVSTKSTTRTTTVYVGYSTEGYLGAVAKAARRSHKMSQQEVATKAGVSFGFVNRMEQGKFQSIKKYLKVLGAIDIELVEGFKLDIVPVEDLVK